MLAVAAAVAVPVLTTAQGFDSRSTGADGALDLTGETGTIVFDPKSFDPPLDPNGDNVFHFTSITIPESVTLRLTAAKLNFAPVYWLASGPVLIEGDIDLRGADGHSSDATARTPSIPGPGGFPGGVGQSVDSLPTCGFGPGGGTFVVGQNFSHAGGGYGTSGGRSGSLAVGATYGNRFLIPLIGGSGGAGRPTTGSVSFGGGAGGGALLIASSQAVTVNGDIVADGGATGSAGGGSGGAIRILAPVFAGNGRLSAQGGRDFGGPASGGSGRVRVEARQQNFTGQIIGESRSASLSPQARFFPESAWPSVRVTKVAGIDVSPTPTGGFDTPDAAINTAAAVTVEFEARNIPVGTTVTLYLFSQDGIDQVIQTTPLSGVTALSTATGSATFPPGFSRVFVRATW